MPPAALPEPRTRAGRDALAALLEQPASALLAFDYDGTLAPIVDDPAAAHVLPGMAETLGRLARHGGLVAVVTGRPATVAVALGGLGGIPGLVVLGQYGLERWTAEGGLDEPAPPAGLDAVRAALAADPSLAGHGLHVEDKRVAVAVHARRAPRPDAALAAVEPRLRALAAAHGLVVEPGRLVLEVRGAGVDKGVALRSLVDAHDPRTVLFAGDDLGDLAAYDAVEALRAEGREGLLVCSGSDEQPALARRADLVVDGPPGLLALLTALADRLG